MYFRPIFDLFYPHAAKPTFDLFWTYFNVFGVSGLLGGLLLLHLNTPCLGGVLGGQLSNLPVLNTSFLRSPLATPSACYRGPKAQKA